MLYKQQKIKEALLKNSKNLNEICNMYYEKKEFTDFVKNRTYRRSYYIHSVKEIMEKFEIKSISELFFLLHRHVGKIIKKCEFCDLEVTWVENRRGEGNTNDCNHKGICVTCSRPYVYSNNDGVCYNCRPHSDETYGGDSRFRLLTYIGNHEFLINIDEVDEAKLMADMAGEYKEWFDCIAEKLKN